MRKKSEIRALGCSIGLLIAGTLAVSSSIYSPIEYAKYSRPSGRREIIHPSTKW